MNKKLLFSLLGVCTLSVATYVAVSFIKTKPMPEEKGDGKTILIKEDGFYPSDITVPSGTTVKFINKDTYWHWPASDPHPSHTFYSELDPKSPIKPGDTWTVTLTKQGKWGIHDHLAPYVIGTLTVQ